MNEQPLISVILPVYNSQKYIEQSINSILNQTYKNFELIIINDGSTDNSETIIKNISDSRIVYVYQKNQGLANTLNNGLKIAKGDFIARQDHDDISYAARFEKQIDYFIKHPKCGLLGTWASVVDETGKKINHYHQHPTSNFDLKLFLLFDNPFVHTSVMFKKEIVTNCGKYNELLNGLVQDFEYWFRISKTYQVANLPEVLIDYRQLSSGMSFTEKNYTSIVQEQSYNHIKSFANSTDSDSSKLLSQFFHGTNKGTNKKHEINNALHLLKKIAKQFNVAITENELNKNLKKYKYLFEYKFYNSKIYNPNSNIFVILFYKIKRRLLIWFKKV